MNAQGLVVDHTDIGAAFRRLSLPLALQMLGDQLLGIVDSIAIGTLGIAAYAGLTGAMVVFLALMMTMAGLWNGLSIIAAQRNGAGDPSGFGRTVRAGGLIPGIVSLAIALTSIVWARPLLELLLPHVASADASATYLMLRCVSFIPLNVSAVAIVGLGAAGNRKLGIYVLAIINLVHIPLLLALGLGWWTGHPFGIVGAGVATLISETIAAIFAVFYLWSKPIYRVFETLAVDWSLALRCAWLGLPESVFEFALFFPDIIIIHLLAPLGAATIAGFRALCIVSDLTFIVPIPLQSATQTVIGQRLGAVDVEGAHAFLRRSLRYTFIVTTVAGALVAALSWPLAFLFTMQAEVASIAALPLALHMVTMPIKGWAMVALAPIRAAGDTKFSMAVGLVCAFLVIPITWIGIEVLHIGLFSVPVGWITAWSARALLTHLRLRTEDWKQAELLSS